MTRTLASVLGMLIVTLAACGGPLAEGTPTTTSEPGAESPAPDGTVLRWRSPAETAEQIAVNHAVSTSMEVRGVTPLYEPGSNAGAGYRRNLLTELSAGSAPDVFWVAGADLAEFATRGLILDLAPLANRSGYDNDHYDGVMAHLTFDPTSGKTGDVLWGLPRSVSTLVMYVNLDLVAEAAVEDPRTLASKDEWTWKSFADLVDDISSVDRSIKGYGQRFWWGSYGQWMNAAGGGFFKTGTNGCNLDSSATREGLGFLADLRDRASVVPIDDDATALFQAGRVGLLQADRSATPGMRNVEFAWDVVTLPVGPGGPSNWMFWGAYVVSADTDNPEAAWRLVQALTTLEVQIQVAEFGADVPSHTRPASRNSFVGLTPPENNEAFLDGLTNDPVIEAPLWDGSWPVFSSIMDEAVRDVLDGRQTLDEYQATICDDVGLALGE